MFQRLLHCISNHEANVVGANTKDKQPTSRLADRSIGRAYQPGGGGGANFRSEKVENFGAGRILKMFVGKLAPFFRPDSVYYNSITF